jgi:hypothetical protein
LDKTEQECIPLPRQQRDQAFYVRMLWFERKGTRIEETPLA